MNPACNLSACCCCCWTCCSPCRQPATPNNVSRGSQRRRTKQVRVLLVVQLHTVMIQALACCQAGSSTSDLTRQTAAMQACKADHKPHQALKTRHKAGMQATQQLVVLRSKSSATQQTQQQQCRTVDKPNCIAPSSSAQHATAQLASIAMLPHASFPAHEPNSKLAHQHTKTPTGNDATIQRFILICRFDCPSNCATTPSAW